MKSSYVNILPLVLIAGLVSACGAQPATTAESPPQPTQVVLPATESPTDLPAATDTPAPTEPAATIEPAAGGGAVSFASDILPIIQSRCINCHGGNRTEEGLVMITYADLLAGSDNGPVVIPGDAASSLFVELVTTRKMPKRGPKLTPPQIQLFTDWVNQGAQDN